LGFEINSRHISRIWRSISSGWSPAEDRQGRARCGSTGRDLGDPGQVDEGQIEHRRRVDLQIDCLLRYPFVAPDRNAVRAGQDEEKCAPSGPLGFFLDLLTDLLEIEKFLPREVKELSPLCFVLTFEIFVIFDAIELQHERTACDHSGPTGEEIPAHCVKLLNKNEETFQRCFPKHWICQRTESPQQRFEANLKIVAQWRYQRS
jgi:hypothetical protein